MIKLLHFIKLGENNLTDMEMINIESWKKIYPDFKIKYWSDENTQEFIEDCPFILENYKHHYYGFVSDYLRLRLVYEYGGMYMDTDVFCNLRIPDKYFEKAFIPWSPEYCTIDTCTGTATYAPKPKMRLFKDFVDRYKNIDMSKVTIGSSDINNKYIDKCLDPLGFERDDAYGCSLKDQDLGQIVVPNRIQFGFTDFRAELPLIRKTEYKDVYLMHNYLSSWGVKMTYEKDRNIWYIIIRDDSDINFIGNWVQFNWGFTSGKDLENPPVLIFFINSVLGKEDDLIIRMRILNHKDAFDMKQNVTWKTAYLGNGLSREEEQIMINNYLLVRTPYISSVKEIKF